MSAVTHTDRAVVRASHKSHPVVRWLRRNVPYVILVSYCVVVLVPIVWVMLASVKTRREVFLSPLGLPDSIQWQNYFNIFESGFQHYIWNSLVVTIGSVVPMVIVSIMAAYALARRVFIGRKTIYLLIVLTYAIPIHSILIPLYRIVDDFGMLNTYAGLILPHIAIGIPFSVVILYSFFLDFPEELEEAARLDGCSPWRILFSVVLPLSAPAVLSVVIFQTVSVWNEFLWASIATSGEERRLWTNGIMQFQGEYSSDWPKILAVVNLMMVPLLVIYVLAQKHFVRAFAGMGK
ncbi:MULTISPECIES: carbohydrate ABC transporter permease [Halocynthiibacter]|uniref:Carbohydrate ABC transporter permease n=1 Tax=Halocynthiibacter halioticoli TaxID=2986804 RepID=A0AAE3IWQ2_9RHOB|nr:MULTISPECIES: carbohydrate ABC transporter permease [Halocynthiibacter]MCV6823488.1 carbohydrate ABC transporter permease [Halocynthiibacter halioticoli]MCW4056489.1 carbohydrate ABC transporter permease [Halocynthiibacter sp. SDUM655004]